MSFPVRRAVEGVVLLAAVAGVLLWATGAFRGPGVRPGVAPHPPGLPAPGATAVAVRAKVPLFEEAVGTVRTRTSVTVAAQVTARVIEVTAKAGQEVTAGKPLVVLDDRELEARVAQARQALAAAEAARLRADQAKAQGEARLAQATARNDRVKKFLAEKAATPEQAEAALADFLLAQAGLADAEAAIAAADAQREQAKQVVAEAEVALGHARIPVPIDGVVAERIVEPGDLAWPGRTLLVILDPNDLRLEAQVHESLIARIAHGAAFPVALPAVGKTVDGTVSEVIPAADPLSRTFTVRADLPRTEGVYPGMFGRLRIPLGEREAVRVPAAAVKRVGQLETVVVRTDGEVEGARWERRLVTTGATGDDGWVEALSGLVGGETVGLPEPTR